MAKWRKAEPLWARLREPVTAKDGRADVYGFGGMSWIGPFGGGTGAGTVVGMSGATGIVIGTFGAAGGCGSGPGVTAGTGGSACFAS